jgi:hypothetical protein
MNADLKNRSTRLSKNLRPAAFLCGLLFLSGITARAESTLNQSHSQPTKR